MQSSHRRNKTQALPRTTNRARRSLYFVNGSADFQERIKQYGSVKNGSNNAVEPYAEGTHLTATCAPSSIPPKIPLLRRMSTFSCSDAARALSVAATTRPKGQFEAGSAASAG